jgi:hypothetical protein
VAVVVPSPATSEVLEERHLDGIGENIDAAQHAIARVYRKFDVFSSH